MEWTALVPFRAGTAGKSRLESAIGSLHREQLALDMANHVMCVLSQVSAISTIMVLSNRPFDHPATALARDQGRGLNPEISAFRDSFGSGPLLVIHADLPLLATADIEAILEAAAGHGVALATDRLDEGTNAIALADGRQFSFQFGPGSRALHCASDEQMPVLRCPGLSADLDTPDDLAYLRQRGLPL